MSYIRVVSGTCVCVALIAVSAQSARGDTVLAGSYNNSPNPPGDGDGYDAGSGAYAVSPDVGGTPSATFNDNSSDGIYAPGGATFTIAGGQFNNNGGDGLDFYSSSATISGGSFTGDADGVYDTGGTISISGGTFASEYGVFADYQSHTIITGGAFDSSTADFYVDNLSSSFDIYGQFAGLTPGQTQTLTVTGLVQSFTGTLEDDAAQQTFTYRGNTAGSNSVTLHDIAAVPEPTSASGLAATSLLFLRRRRRK